MAKEQFLTTTDDEPGEGPDLPGVASGDRTNALARLLAERKARLRALPGVPRPTLPSVSLPAVSLPSLRRGRRDADRSRLPGTDDDAAPDEAGSGGAVDPEPGGALEDALVDALTEDTASTAGTTSGTDGDLPDPDDLDLLGDLDDGSFEGLVAEWVRRAIDAYPRPSYPLEQEWDVSVQGLVRLIPYVPRFATAPFALLDRFGAVTVGPERVGLDGKDVDWDRVVEVRTAPAWTCLSAEALEANLAQYVVALPPLPGRSWVLRKIGELLFSLYLTVLPPDLDDDAQALLAQDREEDEPMFDRVVTHVVYRRRFGQGEAQASTASVLLQLALRGSTDTVVRTAAARGVDVVHVRVEDTSMGQVVERAAAWRRSALDLRDRVARRVRR